MSHVATEESLLIIHETHQFGFLHLLSIQHENPAAEGKSGVRRPSFPTLHPSRERLGPAPDPPLPCLAHKRQHQSVLGLPVRIRPQWPQTWNTDQGGRCRARPNPHSPHLRKGGLAPRSGNSVGPILRLKHPLRSFLAWRP